MADDTEKRHPRRIDHDSDLSWDLLVTQDLLFSSNKDASVLYADKIELLETIRRTIEAIINTEKMRTIDMIPYPDDWELDRIFFPLGSVNMTHASANRHPSMPMPEFLYECSVCAAIVLDRKGHYFWHHPESKEARRG